MAQQEAAQSLGQRPKAPMELNPLQERLPGDRLGTWARPGLAPLGMMQVMKPAAGRRQPG